MFDFEKLDIYQVLRELNFKVFKLLNEEQRIDPVIKDRWKQSSLNSVSKLIEGTARMTNEEKKEFVTMARSSVFESVGSLQLSFDMGQIQSEKYQELYEGYEKASKMLLGMYRSFIDK